ncbi:family 16 glycosylhydrolase [Salinimicrobium sp. 3283s]|uniref:family 16 glycosylhydrolase n=1 Tax=Salinimicrobium sp. 3283s TaxID=3114359 RepID=UPI0031EA6D87
MKNNLKIKNIFFILLLSVLAVGCAEEDFEFGELTSPKNLSVSTEVVGQSTDMPYGDGSGEVVFNASADGAMTYKYIFENGSSGTASNGTYTHQFSKIGTNVHTVTVVAYGPSGTATSTPVDVEVLVTYEPPAELIQKLVGKEWRIKASAPKHFGLGPVGGEVIAEHYGAGPNDKAGTGMYDDRYIFNEDGTFTHIVDATNDDPTPDPTGTVFGRINLVDQLGATCSEEDGCTVDGADVMNIPFTDYTENWSISAPGGVETINLTGTGFIGYYIGGDHTYEIFDRSAANELVLRSTDGNGEFDWWFVLTSEEEGAQEPEDFETEYTKLVWEQDFESGSLDTSIWNFETGNGENGWGNQEKQYYTTENAEVVDGNLVITAKAEASNGFNYTSSRITTKDNFEFKYGRVEARAKLPEGAGTWPAIWMLGSNFNEVGWPDSGEIDIMEHVGNDQNTIHGTLHYPGRSGGNADGGSTTVEGVSSDFHLYSVEWSPERIVFIVDNEVYHTYENSADSPFNQEFFLILNVAMGGNFGGEIDPDFSESSMIIDYIKVFQAEE